MRFRRDPVGVLLAAAQQPGDVGELRVGAPALVLKRPDDVGHVLMVNGANYEKTPRLTARYGRRTLGHGLFTAANAEAASMRRPVQGAFRRSAIADMGPVVRECMEERVSRWRSGEVIELMGELGTLERTIRTRILFGDRPPAELESMLARRRRRFRTGLVGLARRPGAFAPGGGSMMEGERQLARAIEARRREPTGDLLSALVASGIPPAQVRAEVLMTLTAGSGAAARGEAWTLWEMAERPEMAERIGRERGDMEFTKAVVAEVLRLRPPSPLIVSHAHERDQLPSGHVVRAGTKMLISPLVLHRNPAHFPDPDRFDPGRFEPAARKARPRFHYLPFGAGARNCIGRELALLETVTIASVIAQRFELEPAGSGPEAVPTAPPRPAAPVHVRMIAR